MFWNCNTDAQERSQESVQRLSVPLSVEDSLKALQERQDTHERQIAELREQLDVLRAKPAADHKESVATDKQEVVQVVPVDGQETNPEQALPVLLGGAEETSPEEQVHPDEAEYELNMSVWDATLLIFFPGLRRSDQFVLMMTFVLNIGLQALLLLVIWYDMLDNPPYNSSSVQQMVKWRHEIGHANDQADYQNGESESQRLCDQELWSYEQDEYSTMYNYLYQPIEGKWLSMLSVVVWTLTCLAEWRCLLQQALAIFHLPAASSQDSTTIRRESSWQIVAIQPRVRFAAITLLCIPRLAVLIWLGIAGLRFLAQTAALNDIVLNAVALSFVLDVDEQLCGVLLTQRLRTALANLDPIPCCYRSPKVGGLSLKDLVRYVLFVCAIAFTYHYGVKPFASDVEAAAMALCAGRQDFTYTGGVEDNPTITLINTTERVASCDGGETLTEYMSEFYNVRFNTSAHTTRSSSTVPYQMRRLQWVYAYALKGCGSGRTPSPLDGSCVRIPEGLLAAIEMPENVDPGQDPEEVVNTSSDEPFLRNCKRLNASLGAEACEFAVEPIGQACLWSLRATECEQDVAPPGHYYDFACTSDLLTECNTWEHIFDRRHPTKNCDILNVCPPDNMRCAVMSGNLGLSVRNLTAFDANQTLTTDALTSAFQSVFGYDPITIAISGFDDVQRYRNATWAIEKMPETLLPANVTASGDVIISTFNSLLATALNNSNDTLEGLIFVDSIFQSDTEYAQQTALLALPDLLPPDDGLDDGNLTDGLGGLFGSGPGPLR